MKHLLLVLIGIGMMPCTQAQETDYSQSEKMRTQFHNATEDLSINSNEIKANMHFREDTLIYSLHYFIETNNKTTDWIHKGNDGTEYLNTTIPYVGVNVIEIRFWEKGIHLLSLYYDVNHVDGSFNYILNEIEAIN